MAETSVTRITKLESSQDYERWIRGIKYYATQLRVWAHCNPDTTAPSTTLTNPIPKPVYTANAITEYVQTMNVWKFHQDEIDKHEANLMKVNLAINQSVDPSLQGIYSNLDDPRDILLALKTSIKPNKYTERAWIEEEYEKVKKTPTNKVTEYFQQWKTLANKATSYTEFITQFDMVNSLLNALEPLMPTEVGVERVSLLKSREKPNIDTQITFFEQLSIIKFPNGKFKGKTLQGNFATLQGKDQDGKQVKGEVPKPSRPNKPCLCGEYHWFSHCKHLNPHIERSPNWKPDRKLKQEIEDKLKQDPKLADKVKKSINKWLQKQEKGKEQDHDPIIASAVINAGLINSTTELFNCVILDSGSNIHIANDSLSDRIIATRLALPTEVVYTGNGPVQRQAIVDVIVHLKDGASEKS